MTVNFSDSNTSYALSTPQFKSANANMPPLKRSSSMKEEVDSVEIQNLNNHQNNDNQKYLKYAAGAIFMAAAGVFLLKSRATISKKSNKIIAQPVNNTKATNCANTAVGSTLTTIEEGLNKLLAEKYTKSAELKRILGDNKKADLYTDFANKALNNQVNKNIVIYNLINENYNALRCAKYTPNSLHNLNIHNVTGQSTSATLVDPQGGWHYRFPAKRNWSLSGKSIDRVSMNAVANEGLIKALDDYFSSGQINGKIVRQTPVKGYYKTPEHASEWLDRHDPITMYFHEPLTQEIEQDLAQITAKYVRSENDIKVAIINQDVLPGRNFASGLAAQTSPQVSDIQALIDKSEALDPVLKNGVQNYLTSNQKLKASSGQMIAVQKVLTDYEQIMKSVN